MSACEAEIADLELEGSLIRHLTNIASSVMSSRESGSEAHMRNRIRKVKIYKKRLFFENLQITLKSRLFGVELRDFTCVTLGIRSFSL